MDEATLFKFGTWIDYCKWVKNFPSKGRGQCSGSVQCQSSSTLCLMLKTKSHRFVKCIAIMCIVRGFSKVYTS